VFAQTYTETFYVCEGGDGSLPEVATCGTAYDGGDFNTAGNWDTDDQDDGKIGPNDLVSILDDGGKIRAALTPQKMGLSGKPITIQGEVGGTAEVTGFDIITGWGLTGGNVWEAAVATEPLSYVLFDDTVGTEVSVCTGDIDAANEWCWNANVLYVYSTSDPDTAFTDPGIEAGQRNVGFSINQASYLTIDGLIITGVNGGFGSGIRVGTWNAYSPEYITIQNCEIFYHTNNGILVDEYTDEVVIIDGNDIHDTAGNGILVSDHTGSGSGTESYVQNNQVYDNVNYGVLIQGDYYIVQSNQIYDNGVPAGAPSIAVEVTGTAPASDVGNNNIVRWNLISGQQSSGNDGQGILIDTYADYNQVYYNVIYSNHGSCVGVYTANNAQIYNNSCYANALDPGGATGSLRINDDGTDRTTDITYRNNIFYGTAVANPIVVVTTIVTNNANIVINNNVYYQASGDWWAWGASTGDTLSGWQTASSQGADDVNSDPLFVDISSDDFHLQAGSPAISAGTDVGLTVDYDGETVPSAGVDVGAFEAPYAKQGWWLLFWRNRNRRPRE
jgi:hypothetical protein